MDFIGVALAGMGEPLARILLEEVEEQGGRPQASMFRTGKKASLSQAPLVNGTAGHALDDDVNSGCNGHPSTLLKLLRELGIGAVPHGFRSSFRDWAAEKTEVAREVCELALAHVISDRVEAAYRRSDLFEKRRDLMAA